MLPKEQIEKILDAARVAPSAKTDSRGNFLSMVVTEKKKILSEMRKGIKRELKEPLFKESKRLLPMQTIRFA